jgi:hypothetical protein
MTKHKATSDAWTQYYAEVARRDQHGRNDPIQLQWTRARIRERLKIVMGLMTLVSVLLGYVAVLLR